MKLTATVVTFNEEKNILRCLKSVSFADEIVVIDSGSTDRTIPICRKFTRRIYNMKFTGYDAIKNAAVSRARGEWVFSIDADEEATPELREKILAVIASKPAENGWMVKRRNFFLGKEIRHCGWGKDYQMRLFRRKAAEFRGAIHEKVAIKGTIGAINEALMHYSYADSRDYFAKLNKYTTLSAMTASPRLALLNMLIQPGLRFFRMYFLKAGFLDGVHGFILSVYSGFSDFVKYAKLREQSKLAKPGRTLIRMPNWIGDCVLATALLPALAGKYGKLTVLVKNSMAGIFEGNPHVARVSGFDGKSLFSVSLGLRGEKFENAFSFAPSLSSHLSLLLSGARKRFGYANDLGGILLTSAYKRDRSHKRESILEEFINVLRPAGGLDFTAAKQELYADKAAERRFMKKYGSRIKRGVVLAPYAGFGPAKEWPAENFFALAAMILKKKKSSTVFLTGGPADREKPVPQELLGHKRFHDLRGMKLQETIAMIKNCAMFAGNDSGLMHVADAFDKDMAVIFGATPPSWGGPLSARAEIFYQGLDCQPCFRRECRYGHYNCLKRVKVEDVYKRVAKKI